MKFNRFSWENYLQTERGKNALVDFSLEGDNPKEMSVSFCYNGQMRMYDEKESKDYIRVVLDDYWDFVVGCRDAPESTEDARKLYDEVISNGLVIGGKEMIAPNDFEFALQMNVWISWLLYQLAPDFFFPNLFQFQAYNLYNIADAFGIDLPPVPKKSDYKARCMYYWELCEVFHKFRTENNLTPSELCAFLYDYAPNFTPNDTKEMPQSSQVWMIGGAINEIDHADNDIVFWQCSQETRKGDIIVHYETAPVSAITHIWQAATDGMIDPFFRYYGCAYITNRIDVPRITLDELKSDTYFSKHPLVKKNMQGVNGWPLSATDYEKILKILAWKGAEVIKLPKLYAPTIEKDDNIKIERDVELVLLEPLLSTMGIQDYKRQVSLKFGRTDRGIPDYILHYREKEGDISAKVLIEAKYHMKTPQETYAAFEQARSYAYELRSNILVLCDKVRLMVYENKGGYFDRSDFQVFRWKEMADPDKFSKLRRLLE